MNLHRILAIVGAALTAGGTATTGTLSSVLGIVGAAVLFLTHPSKIMPGSDDNPTGA